ncbi:hypothetical protein OCOJLMKI_4531 [Methylobacterium iners]|uniref:Uncharacterized protein n=1 Tax=Methylobacterium iners TaxID=418707 RepID=A0ABQ4S6A3_9HYPH|nr:hypothetical protein OCOJLMKI_4531 [Methylobacterium iners]
MNCRSFELVERAFHERPLLEMAACARLLSRAHEAHTLALTHPRTAQKAEHARALSSFWSGVGLWAGIEDLIEEHHEQISSCLRADLLRLQARSTRDLTEPHPDRDGRQLHLLLPPREYLPNEIPAALVEVLRYSPTITQISLAAY